MRALAAPFRVSQPAISERLKVLEQAGLSRSRQPHQGRLRGPPARLRRAFTRPPLPGIRACEDDGPDQVLSGYILLPGAKLVAPRSVRGGRFVRTCQRLKADESAPGRSTRWM